MDCLVFKDSNTEVDGGYDARSMVKMFQHLQEAFAGVFAELSLFFSDCLILILSFSVCKVC